MHDEFAPEEFMLDGDDTEEETEDTDMVGEDEEELEDDEKADLGLIEEEEEGL